MQNKKIQLWALSMSGYNCSIEYIAGITNTCAELLSRHSDNIKKVTELTDKHDSGRMTDKKELDVNENLFQTNVLDSNQFEPRTFASCEVPNEESFEKCDCSDFIKVGLDIKSEQTRDEETSEIRSMITSGKEMVKKTKTLSFG